MKRQPILALDMATRTGWAVRDRDGNVTSGVQSFELTKWESHGMRVLRFRLWLKEILALAWGDPCEEPVLLVSYERPIQQGHKGKRPGAAVVTYQLLGVLLAEIEGHGLTHTGPTPAEVKKVATGKGNANKAAMSAAAAARWDHYEVPEGFDPKVGDDEADALCVLAWTLSEIGEA